MTFPHGRRARSTSPSDAPGSAVKTRTVTRYRWITHTVDGETEMVREPYDVEVPVPPRDWDRAVLTGVTAVAAVLLAACVLWSTVNVGGLLTRVAIAPAAYGAAVAFDLAWIVFMAVEWLARYDPARAELPRTAGHVALLVAMVAVGAHGWLSGQKAIGIISAVVSGIVKTVWTVVLRHHSKPLDPLTQQWVDKRRAAAGGKLAMIPIRRELLRAEAQVEAERIALRTDPDADPDESGQAPEVPDAEPVPAITGPMTIADAVRTARDSGFTDPDKILSYVHKVADANAKPSTVERYVRELRRTS